MLAVRSRGNFWPDVQSIPDRIRACGTERGRGQYPSVVARRFGFFEIRITDFNATSEAGIYRVRTLLRVTENGNSLWTGEIVAMIRWLLHRLRGERRCIVCGAWTDRFIRYESDPYTFDVVDIGVHCGSCTRVRYARRLEATFGRFHDWGD